MQWAIMKLISSLFLHHNWNSDMTTWHFKDAYALAPNKNKTHRQSLNKQRANNSNPKKWLTAKEDAISCRDKI
jgi:hypothetical protein